MGLFQYLMMEETDTGEAHHHAVSVAGIDDAVIPDRTAGLGNVGHAAAMSSFDVVTEGEEAIGSQGYARDTVEVGSFFLFAQRLGP